MWMFRWEWFAVATLWGLASLMFKRVGVAGANSALSVAGGLALVVAGIVLLVVRFGFQHAGS